MANIYLRGVEIPGVVKNDEKEVIRQMSTNQLLMELAMPSIHSAQFREEILAAHQNGQRCFMNIEIAALDPEEKPRVEGFSYKVVNASILTDVGEHSRLIGSSKLQAYVDNYDQTHQIPCVIWSRVPSTCYTILIMQPWTVGL